MRGGCFASIASSYGTVRVLVTSTDGTRRKETVHLEGSAVVPECPVRHRQRVDRSRLPARRPQRARSRGAAGAQGRGARSRDTDSFQRSTASCWAERFRRGATSTASISGPRTRWSRSPFPGRRSAATAGVPSGSTVEARPGAIPKLDLSLAIPGLQLTAKGGADGTDAFKLDGRLAVDDLARTGKAAQALSTAAVPAMAGHGEFRADGRRAAGRGARQLERQTGRDSSINCGAATTRSPTCPSTATRRSSPRFPARSIWPSLRHRSSAGTTKLGKLELGAKVRQQTISSLREPGVSRADQRGAAGHVDDDRQGLMLSKLSFSYPKAEWLSEGTAHLRFEEQKRLPLRASPSRAGSQRTSSWPSTQPRTMSGSTPTSR